MRNIKSLCFLVSLSFTSGCTSYEEVPNSEPINPEVDSITSEYYHRMVEAYYDSVGYPNLDSLYAASKAAREKKDKSKN
jgi:hypothetical protein